MYKGLKFRIYPTKEQEVILAEHFGCSRWIWNYSLDYMNKVYKETGKGISAYTMNKEIPKLKKEYPWLKSCYSQCLQVSVFNLSSAFQNFFNKISRYPKFKSKHDINQSVTFPQGVTVLSKKEIKFPGRLGKVKTNIHREIERNIKSSTISKNADGTYYVSFTVLQEDNKETPERNRAIGIDLGLTYFAITSDGSKYSNPKVLKKYSKNLKRKQKKLSRKQKGSNKRTKARIKVAKIHSKISRVRKDFLHKLSRKIVNENQVIVLENLAVKNMVKNHKLAKAISDAAWSTFRRFLKYKAEWENKIYLEVDRFFASSKTCNNCLYQIKELPLNVRSWKCPKCGTNHDRDINAAMNIRDEGLRILASGTGATALGGNVRPKGGRIKSTVLEAVANEEGSQLHTACG